VLVSCATACTPRGGDQRLAYGPQVEDDLSRPTAVTAMISAAMMTVAQAAAGMTFSSLFWQCCSGSAVLAVLFWQCCSGSALAEQLRDGTRVPDRADRDVPDRGVGDGQRLARR